MSPVARTYDYIHGLETQYTRPSYVLKTAGARDLIAKLPSPKNVQRNIKLVPDVPIEIILSTTAELPDHIAQQIENSENRKKFTHKSLLGLCTSGRGMPVEIFLHDYSMMARDPSGELFEEVMWHEVVHGIEGIEINREGDYVRYMPWSYKLQQRMLSIDEENEHEPELPSNLKLRSHINYLRYGTSLQQNVSELFTRIAGIFMYEIKETGKALTSAQDLLSVISGFEDTTYNSRKDSNISDFLKVQGTFSEEAQQLFAKEADELIRRVAALYGCDVRLRNHHSE